MEKLRKIVLDITKIPYNEMWKFLPKGINVESIFELFDFIIKKKTGSIKPTDDKILIHMAGIPGSGKTTYCKKELHGFLERGALYLNFDSIMEEIPDYNLKKQISPVEAFKEWEIPARILGYEILCLAFERGFSILFDNGAVNQNHIKILECFKQDGYMLKMYYLKGKPDKLVERIKRREEETKRHFPIKDLNIRHELLQKNLSRYKTVVDEFYKI